MTESTPQEQAQHLWDTLESMTVLFMPARWNKYAVEQITGIYAALQQARSERDQAREAAERLRSAVAVELDQLWEQNPSIARRLERAVEQFAKLEGQR